MHLSLSGFLSGFRFLQNCPEKLYPFNDAAMLSCRNQVLNKITNNDLLGHFRSTAKRCFISMTGVCFRNLNYSEKMQCCVFHLLC